MTVDIAKKPFYVSVVGKPSNALDKFNKRVDATVFNTDEDNNMMQHFRRLTNVVIDQYTDEMRVEITLRITEIGSVENEARSVEFSIRSI
jgi:RNase adaptor protein for sRNA GlmZ degradation